jgi:WD repeat-containing protein 70
MKMRSMTQEVVVDVLVTMNASPDVPTTNSASKGVNGVRSTNADGDVHMERSPASNGHGDNTPRQSSLAAMDSTPSRTTSNFDFSHHRLNSMEDDDEARPPPANRARKYSDTDQAFITNVSTSVIVRLDRRANSACLLSYLPSANPEDRLSPSCYSILYTNQW